MGKHTPGPWEIWPHSKNRQLCVGHLESHSNLVRAVCEVDPDDAANARLIAAAPDLLAAAETLLAEYEHALAVIGEPFRWGRLVSDQMRAALAAAKGEE